jgi:hypothetical protein
MRLWIYMVETRGVEPLSENIATYASTGVVTALMSLECRPELVIISQNNVPLKIEQYLQ